MGSGADPYAVLGVPPGATTDQVRRAYLALARRHHPDAHRTADPAGRAAAEHRMQEVNEAWSLVGDPVRRAAYDERRATASGAVPAEAAGAPFRPFDDPADDPDPLDLPDEPYRPAPPPSPRSRAATLAPVLLFFASVVALAGAAVLGSVPLVGLSVALFVASCVGFVVLPLVALGAARRDEG
jgi:hypothetical protein